MHQKLMQSMIIMVWNMPAKHLIFNTLNWPNASFFIMLVVFFPIISESLSNKHTTERKNFLSRSLLNWTNFCWLIFVGGGIWFACIFQKPIKKLIENVSGSSAFKYWNRILLQDISIAIAIAISLIVFIHFEYCVFFSSLSLLLLPLFFLLFSSTDYFAGGNFFYLPYN